MTQCLYHNPRLEGELCDRLYTATGCDPHSPMVARRIQEAAAIFQSGCGTLFALAGAVSDFSLERGYPVSFRGRAGSLLVSHLLGIAQNNPMDLGIPWQGAFSPAGRISRISLNVAPEVYPDVRGLLKELAADCNVLWDIPGQPPYRVIFAPELYDTAHHYLTLDLYTHSLLGKVGDAAGAADRLPRREEVLSPAFIKKVWEVDMWDAPILEDIAPLRDFAPELAPSSFPDLTRLLALSLAPRWRWEDLDAPGVSLDSVIATPEDVYDSLLENGASREEALAALRRAGDLYPRGQCAEYLTYALLLAWFRDRAH